MKALKTLKNIIVWLFAAFAVAMMVFTIFSVTSVNRTDRSVFGLKIYIVKSDSMAATDFDAGDLIFVRAVDPRTLEAGDVISFISMDSESYGESVTHKIRERVTLANGEPAFVTYGTTTGVDDASKVEYGYVLGKYTGRIPKLGYFFEFMKTTPGYIVCIFIPFLLLILYNGFNMIRNFRRYKKEQNAALEEERKKIAEERAESLELMKKLEELQAQLAAKGVDPENASSGDCADINAGDTEDRRG